jgi:ATP-dependent DNA helicase RecQ
MKEGHEISVDRARRNDVPGGRMAKIDPVGNGRVTLLDTPPGDEAQAVAALDEFMRLSRLDPDWQWRDAAIIARDWRRLEPVRSYAEHLGIPVEMANEGLPSLWRLREMQTLVRDLLSDRTRLMTIADLLNALNRQPRSFWTDVIGEGIGTLAREIDEKAMPVPDLVQWLGEWAREARTEQRGLLLLTAHRAKGLEFENVAILNGGWDRASRNEDADAPRRLFYVAMTRARQSLTLLTQGDHALVENAGDAILRRRVNPRTENLPQIRKKYVSPDPKLVDLSFAGRLSDRNPALGAIAAAKPGDQVNLVREGERWFIRNTRGETLGRMSRAFRPPEHSAFLDGRVAAILCWRADDSDETHQTYLRRETWEVVLPELVFRATTENPSTPLERQEDVLKRN